MSATQADKMIQQGFMIKEADDRALFEDWRLPKELRMAHDRSHNDFMRVYDDYLDVEDYRDSLPNILEEFEITMQRYRQVLSRVENHLVNTMPDWRYDEHLTNYGFEPRKSFGNLVFQHV